VETTIEQKRVRRNELREARRQAQQQALPDALLLTPEQLQALTGLSQRTIERLTARGVLEAVKPAGLRLRRYVRCKVDEWIAAGCPREERPRSRRR
jgi:excisionase family DNA binding protein